MKKRNLILLIGVLTLSTTLACSLSGRSQPSATAIPGWEKFEGGGVELWLPESYDGGNLDEDLEIVVEGLRTLGPDFAQMADLIEQNPSMFVIWAFDSEVGNSGALTSAAVTTEKVLSAMTIDTYLDAALEMLPPQFRVVEREIVTVGDNPAGRLIIDFTISGMAGKEVMYAVKDGNTMWILTYGTGASEFNQRLPDFEQSVNSFEIQP